MLDNIVQQKMSETDNSEGLSFVLHRLEIKANRIALTLKLDPYFDNG